MNEKNTDTFKRYDDPEKKPYRFDSGNSAGLSSPANREAKKNLDNHIEQNTDRFVGSKNA